MSVTVEELLARIDKLAADIETQKEVLRRLEESRCTAQRELNAMRDPMARLPVEISSRIFLHCLPPCPSPSTQHAAPMLLTNVCKAWTDISLSTSALWNAIHLHHSRADVLQSWLHRAQRRLLSLSLYKRLNTDASVVFGRYAPQLHHLALYDAEPYVHPSTSFPRLQSLTIGALRAEHLRECRLGDFVKLLGLAPNLVRCAFPHADIYDPVSDPPTLTLPHLRSLNFGGFRTGSILLQCLTLPALETLHIPLYYDSFIHLARFLKHSAPPLRTLIVGSALSRIQLPQLDECLRLLPSLTHFELFAALAVLDSAEFITTLADAEGLLPNVRILKIRSKSFIHTEYPTVLRMLSARRPQLGCFHLIAELPRPDAETLDGLRRLVADGMEVVIGETTTNYIST
ncbi:hypothetical protein C8R45DRAFT_505540 [Mycena sanguinolenta]|nr:hypothetical protein C8R45DRAFT_505540 [Mycena sanguinolenta]